VSGQDSTSPSQNAELFARDNHGRDAAELDSYQLIREATTAEVAGTARLLDVSIENIRTAIAAAARVLRPGGRLVMAESCVPAWFYRFERAMFRPLASLARTPLLGGHPAVFQPPFDLVKQLVGESLEIERAYPIPMGRWLTQFGRRWPTTLTPARGVMVVARKRA
jgi:hypothetical protein